MNVRIDGLTNEQVKMLDTMWQMDTATEISQWFETLSEDDFLMAATLHNILMQECYEKYVQEDNDVAIGMLLDIGIVC